MDKRTGETVVTSVSVSKQFQKLINEYNMSPTECFRRGVAVTLCDLGVGMYQSEKNEERLKFVKAFIQKLEEDEKTKELFKKIMLFEELAEKLQDIEQLFNKIKLKELDA